MDSYKMQKPKTYRYETLKPRFRFMPRSETVRLVDNDRIEIRTRANSMRVYVIPMSELTTMRAVAIAAQHLAGQLWSSKEIIMTFISLAICNVAEPNPKAEPVDISRILR